LRADADAAWEAFAGLDAPGSVDSRAAYLRLRRRISERPELDHESLVEGRGMIPLWNRRAFRFSASLVLVVALISAVTLSPVRTLADGVLDRFRVQKFAAITIPMDLMDQGQSFLGMLPPDQRDQMRAELEELGTFETTFSMDSAREVGSIDDAVTHYGASLKVPDEIPDGFGPDPHVYVSDAGTATYVMNVQAVKDMIDEYGIPIYSLPDPSQYPTLAFTAHVPKAVMLEYRGATDDEHIVVGQAASPTLDIPEGIDMNLLREDLLQLPGLPTDLVAQLRAIDDWQHTLIVPIPQGADSSDVTVNGQPGLLIELPNNEGAAVLWEQNDTLYAVAGSVDADTILDIAESM
jgi:hypothetical protein